MKAKIMKPVHELLPSDIFRAIVFGSKEWAGWSLKDGNYKWENTIQLDSPLDDKTKFFFPEETEKHEHDFLEDAFEHTALDEKWTKTKRCISVGDILVIKDGGTWYCAPQSWEKI